MSESIVIANSTIRQQDGLYCLNDLHRASGGKAKSLKHPEGFLGVNSDYLFFFEKFNGEAEHETF